MGKFTRFKAVVAALLTLEISLSIYFSNLSDSLIFKDKVKAEMSGKLKGTCALHLFAQGAFRIDPTLKLRRGL